MKRTDAQRLWHGIYRVYWTSGGSSVAAVGSNSKGQRWLAPTNWVSIDSDTKFNTGAWGKVERVEPITTSTSREHCLIEEVNNEPDEPFKPNRWHRFWQRLLLGREING